MRLGDLSDEIAVFQQNGLFIERFRQFEQLPQETEKNSEKKRNKIPFRKLEMKQVCFGYSPEKRVLQNIDLCIHKGEKVAVVGRNGSGKTTLMNMLSGIYHPDAGSILVGGKEVSINSPVDSRNLGIGMIHQHFKLVDVLTAAENIVLGLEGGMTTGMPLIVTAAMKPIPTLMQPLATVNMDTLEAAQASRERSDVCAVPACAVVAEAEVAIVLADAYLEKFGHDNMTDIKAAVKSYRQRLRTLSR